MSRLGRLLARWGALLSLGLLLFASPASAEPPAEGSDAAFNAANASYFKGDYPAARAAYEALVATGEVADAALWHNLGNARFRLGAYGAAIHAYRSGLALEATDSTVRDALRRNLETARRVLQSRYRAAGDAGFVYAEPGGVAWQLGHLAGLQTLGVAFAACWLALLGLLALRRVRPNLHRLAGRLAVAAALAALLTGGLLGLRLSSDATYHIAVVLASDAQLRDGPHAAAQGKPLPEGLEVGLVDAVDGWSQVELVGGRRGWVEAAALLPLEVAP